MGYSLVWWDKAPDTWGYEIKSSTNKILISSDDGEVLSVNETNIKSIPSLTEQNFLTHGMDDLSSLDFSEAYTKKEYVFHPDDNKQIQGIKLNHKPSNIKINV